MKPEPKPERVPETLEPGVRNHQLPGKMSSEDLAAAYADATRLRAHELSWGLDDALGTWMKNVRVVLAEREHLDLIREFLPVYFDPSRKQPVFGPGGKLVSPGAIERAIQSKPLRQIAAG